MPTVFFTGFPGFLGTSLLARLLRQHPAETAFVCLVQPKFAALAQQRLAEIAAAGASTERVRLVEGDITQPGLGLGAQASASAADVTDVFHLAAVYDLGVSREVGIRVNVEGTRHMLAFAARAPRLVRFHYVSTCYVSGRHRGVFRETDLEKGQPFNNAYEETKYLAEVLVQEQMRAGLPATIYRPSIVVGDSRTGATQKYDGPYYVLQWVLRWQTVAPVPVVGVPSAYTVNLVPHDFVADAIAYLSERVVSAGQVYHLVDPNPLTVHDLIGLIEAATGRQILRVPLPLSVAKALLRHVAPLRQWLRIEPETVDYFVHPTSYTCDHTLRDLVGSGIACPPIRTYFPRLVAFARDHPDLRSRAMV